ncbi:MAG: glycosyltransferase family 2 protein [Myxococcota bacterium]|nr:glycosyltransferase family 2 protein [Myxococcota bacterium]
MKDLSVVVVTWNTKSLTLACLGKLQVALRDVGRRRDWSSEVIVVDNGSTDGTSAELRARFPEVELQENESNLGFAAGMNGGLRKASGNVVLLLNSDAFVGAATIEACMDALSSCEKAGMAGPRLLHSDGRIQRSVHTFPGVWDELFPRFLREARHSRRERSDASEGSRFLPVDALRGAVLFVRKTMIEDIGPLPEDYFFFLEETDWCWQAREKGWQVLLVPQAPALHLLGESSKRREPARTRIEFQRSLDRFLRKNRGESSARIVLFLRIVRGVLSGLFELPVAAFSSRARARLKGRWRLLGWQFRGRPAAGGLEGWSGESSD